MGKHFHSLLAPPPEGVNDCNRADNGTNVIMNFPAESIRFDWADFLYRHQDAIVDEWARRLGKEISERYSQRPESELRQTIGASFEANCRLLIDGKKDKLDEFIGVISRLRLEGGFPLMDVQKAFDLFRHVALPLLADTCTIDTFHRAVVDLNDCMAYTIYQFSDIFQALHHRQLTDYATQLKLEVSEKTAELRESELKYKTLVEEITDGYVVLYKGAIFFTNRAFRAMHGYSDSDLPGNIFLELVMAADHAEILNRLNHVTVDGEDPPVLEYSRITRTGDIFPTEIKFKTIHYGDRWWQVGICRDITERIELAKKMREAERLADIAQIATSLSHEIRNPLSAIKMNLQILQRRPELVGNDRRRVDIAVHEMHRLESVLQEVLDFAKPVVLDKTPGSLNRILMQVVELLEMKFAEKRLDVSLYLDDLPDMLIDGRKMEQVALNLLLNAVEAAPDASHIRVSSDRRPSGNGSWEVAFCVEDEGETIPPPLCESIFKPFFTTKSRGAGLGLSVVKRLVEAHGGRVSVSGRVPKGSVFTVVVPEEDVSQKGIPNRECQSV
jgi:PAS domain S-box-containing protein